MPPLPISKPRYGHILEQLNKKTGNDKPWTKGLYESLIAVDWIYKQKFEQKNRFCLILLDSTIEIAFKEYLVNESGQPYNAKRLIDMFNDRTQVNNEVKKTTHFDSVTWGKIEHYYRMRCKLVHEKTTIAIGGDEIESFREVLEEVLAALFGLKFS